MAAFQALVYKNWILYKRSPFSNCLELLIPIFFIGFVIMVPALNPPVLHAEQTYNTMSSMYRSYTNFATGNSLKQCPSESRIAVIPATGTLVTSLTSQLTGLGLTVKPFASEADLETYLRSSTYRNSPQICWSVVVVSDTPNYKYKLRFNITTGGEYRDGPETNLRLTLDQGMDLNTYSSAAYGGMLSANTLIQDLIMRAETASTDKNFELSMFPAYQEDYIEDNIFMALGQSVPTIFLLPLLILYLRQTSGMLSQKQSKVRQSMRIMGMRMGTYYATWFMRYYIIYVIVHSVCSGVIAYQFSYVPFYIPFLLYLLFDIVIILQNFFIQIFLSRAKIGVVIALLFYVLQFVLSLLSTNSDNPTEYVNNLLSIVPHVAFILAFQNMIYCQSKQITATFTNSINQYTIQTAVFSFLGNIAVYLLLVWYLDQVVPSEWGAKRHPLFCCCERTSCRPNRENRAKLQTQPNSMTYIEEVQKNFKKMQKTNEIIEIQGLRKEFNGGDTVAVQDLDLKMYKNQIFAMLGHNGAGKTTTISMITGLIEPTDGYISVFGETDIDRIREMIGLCPQHDTLYEDLTVKEHLELFATFKGLEGEELEAEVEKLITDVNLSEKRDEYSKNLSGGQKRRLSVAIAFAGKSKVIILDEPTSGMDTSARRYIWDLLKTYKNDRIIILTTHFMDEADFLGDRIGIMGNGRVLCCGSSIYLKNKFGIGYNITFVKQSSQTDSEPILKTVQKHVADAKILSNVSSEVSMQLPLEDIRKFSALFNEIDAKKGELRVSQYGISVTTLEEVFLRVSEQLEEQDGKEEDRREREKGDKERFYSLEESSSPTSPVKSLKKLKITDIQNSSIKKLKVADMQSSDLSTVPLKKRRKDINRKIIPAQTSQLIQRERNCCTRFCIHFTATLLKRFRVIKRDVKSFIFELVLPLGIIICALFLMRVSFINDLPSQEINLATYLSEQNPVIVPIGSAAADSALLAAVKANMVSKYGTQIQVDDTASESTVDNFDKNWLFPRKKAITTLKGGLYFSASYVMGGGNTAYPISAMPITRSPTAPFFLPTLAAQSLINSQFSKSISITMVNHPMPLTYDQLNVNNTISGFLGAFIFTLALAFKFASIISFIVKEREDRVKHQQIVSGMSLSAYWMANFLYDYLLYLIVALPAAGMCMILKISSLVDGDAVISTWLLFSLYGLAYIPLTYIFAFVFKDYGNAQSFYFFATFFTGGLLPILTLLLRILSASTNEIGRYVAWALRAYPAFAFGESIVNLGSISAFGVLQNNSVTPSPMGLDITLGSIFCLGGEFILYTALLFIIEAVHNSESLMRFCSRENSIQETNSITESDVVAEYKKANKADPEEYEILTKHLRKVYMIDSEKQYKVAVDNLSFGIKKGEVFGLLGVNGAGKTTTFKILAGEITSTSGDSYFCGLKISENLDTIRESLGYCPQFDALVENLTVREQLELFYDMKSLPSDCKDALVSQKITELNLEKYADKLSGTLSGGNKRKLSVALAMVGNPKIIFLDEPSTGMDPKARRFMWKVISRIATERKQSTIILTTHSMEEAEALSTRLAIMVKGNFQCIGTPQHIKNRYGEGMQIQIKFKPIPKKTIEQTILKKKLQDQLSVKDKKVQQVLTTLGASPDDKLQISVTGKGSHIFHILKKQKKVDLELLIEYIQVSQLVAHTTTELQQKFSSIELLETLQSFIRVKVIKKPSIGKLFDFFEESKGRLNIQQYTIKQASVEQIFNKFAENQEGSERQ